MVEDGGELLSYKQNKCKANHSGIKCGKNKSDSIPCLKINESDKSLEKWLKWRSGKLFGWSICHIFNLKWALPLFATNKSILLRRLSPNILYIRHSNKVLSVKTQIKTFNNCLQIQKKNKTKFFFSLFLFLHLRLLHLYKSLFAVILPLRPG